MGVNVSVDLSGLEKRFSDGTLRAQQITFAQRVAFDMRKHVPVDEGTLRDSEPLNSNYAKGEIIYNTPYAKEVLNADSVRTVKNPDACPHWPEVTKQERLEAWKEFATALLGGEGVVLGGFSE